MANEERQLDPTAYATKLDLADFRNDLVGKIEALRLDIKDEFCKVRIMLTGLVSKVEGVESRMNTLQSQMRMLFWFQGAILVALAGMILQGVLS